MRGRPRKPVEMLEASGAFQKNPQRRRPPAPKSNRPIGDTPTYLDEEEQRVFEELVADIPTGVTTAPDRYALGLLAMLETKKRRRTLTGYELSSLLKLFSLFGITPSDRSRIAIVPESDSNPFDEF